MGGASCARPRPTTISLLLKINMGAGHGGKSGRWERLHEVAEAYAFVLTEVGQ